MSMACQSCRYLPAGQLAAGLAIAIALTLTLASPTGQARVREQPELAVLVSYSDGTLRSGTLRLMGGRPLVITPHGGSQRQVNAADLLAIHQRLDTATLEQPWVFKEAGKPEKVFLDGHYPLLNFTTAVELVNGETITGHLISAAFNFVDDDGNKSKVFLKRQIKGEINQPLDALVYVDSIRYLDNAPATGGRLQGTIAGAGRLQRVSALDVEREQVLHARLDGDRFDFGIVLPGRYELCAKTDRLVLLGWSAATPAAYASQPPLQAEDRHGIELKFPLADDFFADRWILELAGHRNYAKTLVYKRRADYHAAEQFTPGGWAWHLDVWIWHLPGDEWKLDSRHILARHLQSGDQTIRQLAFVDALVVDAPTTKTIEVEHERDNSTWRLARQLD